MAVILEAQGVSIQRSTRKLLDTVDLSLHSGEMLGLIGPNGAGKSTLLRLLAGLDAADGGVVALDGQDLHSVNRQERARRMAYHAQQADVHWPLSVDAVVSLGRMPHQDFMRRITESDCEHIEAAIRDTEIEHLRGRIFSSLSGGERVRVLLARMFAQNPKIFLADEPVAALDIYHQLHVMELLRERCRRGAGAIVVIHDLNLAARFCDQILLLHKGKCVIQGAVDKVLRNDIIGPVYGVDIDTIERPAGQGHWVIPVQRNV